MPHSFISSLSGSADEVEQQLSTFGISNTQTVITHSGEKKIDKHKEYLKTVKAIEHALSVTPEKVCVLVPSSTDILLGRGKPIQNHPGVSLLLKLIVMFCSGCGLISFLPLSFVYY